MNLDNYFVPYESLTVPNDCPHETVELRDEVLTISDNEKYHINGIYCVNCEHYISTEDSPYSEDAGLSGYKPWRGR